MKTCAYLLLFLVFIAPCSQAQNGEPMLVQKQRFEMASFTTFGGKTIQQLTVGWEAYGQLNSAKDNTVLITHYFSGNSHAAGKYHKDDPAPGYWDAIIGPGKAIDTNRFFVISVDSLANLSVHDANVITTGPATINPQTGKPYGLSFPVVTIRDFVNVQKALLTSLGINKLHAVIGPSMGSMQALDWAIAYPNWVPRMISVIGTGYSDAWTVAALEQWALPIKLDKNWQQGNYSRSSAPIDGLTASLMLITQQALHPHFFNQTGSSPAIQHHPLEQAPLQDIQAQHNIVQWLQQRAKTRTENMDANHLLYLVRACQLFTAGHQQDIQASLRQVKAKTLFLPATEDLLLFPYMAQDVHNQLTALGKSSLYEEISGDQGHLNGISSIAEHSDTIRDFLQTP